MERLFIRAGKRALEMIRDGGFSLDRVTTYVGPAVGPRWLVASGVDLALLRNGKLGSKSRPVLLTGASAGAWRFAAWLQPEPEKSYRRLLDAYIGIPFDRRSTPSSIRRSLQEVIDSFLENDAIPSRWPMTITGLPLRRPGRKTLPPRRPRGCRSGASRCAMPSTGSTAAISSVSLNGWSSTAAPGRPSSACGPVSAGRPSCWINSTSSMPFSPRAPSRL